MTITAYQLLYIKHHQKQENFGNPIYPVIYFTPLPACELYCLNNSKIVFDRQKLFGQPNAGVNS